MTKVIHGFMRLTFVTMAVLMAMVSYFNLQKETANAGGCDSVACKSQNNNNACTGGSDECCKVEASGGGGTITCYKGSC